MATNGGLGILIFAGMAGFGLGALKAPGGFALALLLGIAAMFAGPSDRSVSSFLVFSPAGEHRGHGATENQVARVA